MLKNFIHNYNGSELANEVEKLFNSLDDELFEFAESSKQLPDFEEYLSKFEHFDGRKINEANIYIKDINLYNTLKTKEDYIEYSKEKNRLFFDKAQSKIKEFEALEQKQNDYETTINEKNIPLCEEYLSKYIQEDVHRQNIRNLLDTLTKEAEDKQLFQSIENSTGITQLNLCNRYLNEFENGLYLDKVQLIKDGLEIEIADENLFNNAIQSNTKEAFMAYKNTLPNGKYNAKADDYICYLNAKETQKADEMQKYLDKYIQSGLNIKNAKDCLAYFLARDNKNIEELTTYLIDYNIFKEEAKVLLVILKDEKQGQDAFNNACNIFDSDNSLQSKLDVFESFLRGNFTKQEDHIIYANNKIKDIIHQIQDNKDFENAEILNTEDSYFEYMQKYGKEGISYPIAKERYKGITDKDKAVLNATHNISNNLENGLNTLSNQFEDLGTQIKNQNKLLLVIIFVPICIFIILCTIFVIKYYSYIS